MSEDAADRHVARWQGHWVLEDADFDEVNETIVVRMGNILRHLHRRKKVAAATAGLQPHEYDTLHSLMIRDTPGTASPTDLAGDLEVSPAGITGRLDALERAGHVRRTHDAGDRRRMIVEATDTGIALWRRAMALREQDETQLLDALSADQRATLAALLKQLTLDFEEGWDQK